MNRFLRISIFAFLLLFHRKVDAQNHLEKYITQGLASNESIKKQQFILEKNLYALQEAKALFLPAVNLNTTYTLAGGGRTVDFPVGDLLNPVYGTLNKMTGTNDFPSLQNQSILLNPNNFYDLKVRTTYPIINAEIALNKKLKSQQYDLQKIEIDVFKRELVKDIKVAYYQYLQATEAIKIYENALVLVNENERVNNSLFNNQKVNRTALSRSNNEVLKMTSQIKNAKQKQNNAKAYLNFLLNRPLDTEVLVDKIEAIPIQNLNVEASLTNREELQKLNTAKAIYESLLSLAKSAKMPKLNSFLDLGSQGFNFKVNNKTPYYFLGLSLEWNIFSGDKNKAKVSQALADGKALEAQTNYVEQQLALQVKLAINAFSMAITNYQTALSQAKTSEDNYRDMLRLYKEGTVLLIELLDAQNQLISAQLQTNISLFDTWIKQTEIERANASFTIK
ncbi:hypothetical protein GCM10011514_49700 [Emticicia aquatilis]|uniref:TolC family protein n=1 Tax=Emticicia aquatilis TaxID=1537369 RepID=A0A916Z7J3_9BACT|nr:TolC family protein [Emticicia aquatilis]GGD79765.1 hypothetical protein GCM10011514_49700 [Emticicia aquatilis]